MAYFSSQKTYNDFISKKIALLKSDIYTYLRNKSDTNLTDDVYYYLRSKNYILHYYEKMYRFKMDDLIDASVDLPDELEYLDPYEEINPTIDDLIYVKLCIEKKYYEKHMNYIKSLQPKEEKQITPISRGALRLLIPDMFCLSYAS